MIEQHYSHVVPKMFSNQLSSMDMPVEAKEIKDRFDVPDKTKELFAKKAKAWADNYRRRGCQFRFVYPFTYLNQIIESFRPYQ